MITVEAAGGSNTEVWLECSAEFIRFYLLAVLFTLSFTTFRFSKRVKAFLSSSVFVFFQRAFWSWIKTSAGKCQQSLWLISMIPGFVCLFICLF